MVVTRSKRSRRWLWILFGAVLLVVVFLIVEALLLVRQHDAAINSTSATLDTLVTSLDLFEIEYTKVQVGTPLAQTSAAQALARAQSAVRTLADNPLFYKELKESIAFALGLGTWEISLSRNEPLPISFSIVDAKAYAKLLYDKWITSATPATR